MSVQTTSDRCRSRRISGGKPATLSVTVRGRPVEFDRLSAPARLSPFMAAIDTCSPALVESAWSNGRTKSHGLTGQAVSAGRALA